MSRTRYEILNIFIPPVEEESDHGVILIAVENSALDHGIEVKVNIDIDVQIDQLHRLVKARESVETAMQTMGIKP